VQAAENAAMRNQVRHIEESVMPPVGWAHVWGLGVDAHWPHPENIVAPVLPGTHFTCSTRTKVQTLTPTELSAGRRRDGMRTYADVCCLMLTYADVF